MSLIFNECDLFHPHMRVVASISHNQEKNASFCYTVIYSFHKLFSTKCGEISRTPKDKYGGVSKRVAHDYLQQEGKLRKLEEKRRILERTCCFPRKW